MQSECGNFRFGYKILARKESEFQCPLRVIIDVGDKEGDICTAAFICTKPPMSALQMEFSNPNLAGFVASKALRINQNCILTGVCQFRNRQKIVEILTDPPA